MTMSETDTNLIPGTGGVIPHLVTRGAAEAIDFYVAAFGAEEQLRLPGPDGKIVHACVLINGAPVFLVDEFEEMGAVSPAQLGGSPVTLHLNVADVDAAVEKAVAAGATVTMPVADQFWGDRYGVIQDPFGHLWSIATPKPGAPTTEAELSEAMANAGSA
jgi:PhnB protein